MNGWFYPSHCQRLSSVYHIDVYTLWQNTLAQVQTLKERIRRRKKAVSQFAYINDVAILKADVARNENGASAILS